MAYWNRAKEWYRAGYIRNPYRFAFGTMFAKSVIADSFAQIVLEKNISHQRKAGKSSKRHHVHSQQTTREFDVKRMLRFGLWGGLYCGTVEHWIYNVLFTALWPEPIAVNAFKKMVGDVFVHTPLLYFPVYYMAKSVILGNSISDGLEQYKYEWKTVNVECWKIWAVVQFVLFYFVPIPFRLATMGIFSLFWMSYLLLFHSSLATENCVHTLNILHTTQSFLTFVHSNSRTGYAFAYT